MIETMIEPHGNWYESDEQTRASAAASAARKAGIEECVVRTRVNQSSKTVRRHRVSLRIEYQVTLLGMVEDE